MKRIYWTCDFCSTKYAAEKEGQAPPDWLTVSRAFNGRPPPLGAKEYHMCEKCLRGFLSIVSKAGKMEANDDI